MQTYQSLRIRFYDHAYIYMYIYICTYEVVD